MTSRSRLVVSVVAMASSTALGCGAGSGEVIAGHGDAGSALDSSAAVQGGDDGGAADGSAPDDASGFTGPASDARACHPNFASGVNVAWVRFANDVPNPNIPVFQTLFQNTRAAGGRVARWWFHANGTKTPGYDPANGMALPISSSNIADVKSILDTASAAGMMVIISLWSFDMLKGSTPAAVLANNMSLLTVDANRKAYIDNVLTPLASALAGHPGLYAWEIFNEPEGMVSGQGWSAFTNVRLADGGTLQGQTVPESTIQKTVNLFAAAIHAADPTALVTNGTWSFQANANVSGMTNYYSDSALRSVGGQTNGTLDFYEVHYYKSNQASHSPFVNKASYWALDKPVVIGEFYALDQDGVAAADTYTALHSGGYAGAWAWQYLHNDGTSANNNGGQSTMWPTMQVPMQNLYAAAPSDIACP